MKTVKIAEFKDRLSEHLRAVERGAEVVVTDRNRPVARVVPFVRDPILPLTEPGVSLQSVRKAKRRPANWAISSTDLLADERRER